MWTQFFSKLHFKLGYHQVVKENVKDTIFRTHEGHRVPYDTIWSYKWTIYFPKPNEPPTKQYLRKFVQVFFDDILIYSNSWGKHLEHLKIVLRLLLENKMYAKRSNWGAKGLITWGISYQRMGLQWIYVRLWQLQNGPYRVILEQ